MTTLAMDMTAMMVLLRIVAVMATVISQWVAMMLVAGQNYIDSSGSAIQCMQDKGNGEESD